MLSDLFCRMDKCVLRWLGHIERMDGERTTKRIYCSGAEWDEVGLDQTGDRWMVWYRLWRLDG